MAKDLIPSDPQHDLTVVKNRRVIQVQKDRAIIPALTKIADEVERRAKDGTLSKELKKMKVGALLGNLTRIVAAIKDAAPQVLIQNNAGPMPEETWLKANSAVRLTDAQREKARKEAKAVDAEVIKEKGNG